MVNIVKSILAAYVLSIFSIGVYAQTTKVVVIPMMGDNPAPQFRIVSAGSTTEANRGRLEYTADPNPSPQSTWGRVCSDCLDGTCGAGSERNSAATAICKDMGYTTGILDNSFWDSGSLGFLLDSVICPEGANSFRDCSSSKEIDCSVYDQAGVYCLYIAASKLVFATSTTYNGDLVTAANNLPGDATYTDGLLAGDALCQSRAEAAGHPGTYKAWLSSATGSPATRFTRSKVHYVLPSDEPVATDWDDLTDCCLISAIDRDENNKIVYGNAITNTNGDGTKDTTAGSCNNYTDLDFNVVSGNVRDSAYEWSFYTYSNCSTNTFRLYCFQQ